MSHNLKTLKVVPLVMESFFFQPITASRGGSIRWAPSGLNLRGYTGGFARGEYP
jgi:hypothetical protein